MMAAQLLGTGGIAALLLAGRRDGYACGDRCCTDAGAAGSVRLRGFRRQRVSRGHAAAGGLK